MSDALFRLLTSLRLTFVLLALSALLVFLGTMAQDPLGLYLVQERFFRSLFVDAASMTAAIKKTLQMFQIYLTPTTASDVLNSPRIPAFPGGYLLGSVLLINLFAAHLRYYKSGTRKLGIAMIHVGIVLLLLGQFATDAMQVESHMRLTEGRSKQYSENGRANELVVLDTTDPATNTVVALSQAVLERGGDITLPPFPFKLRLKDYYLNSQPEFVRPQDTNRLPVQGVGNLLTFQQQPRVTRLEARDVPAARVELVAGETSLGQWWVSNWLSEEQLSALIWRQASAPLKQLLEQPQSFAYAGRRYELALRPVRYYKPFALELVDFQHDKYPGTEIPKNFSSRVRILNPNTEENREVLIYMNNPLRYNGETYYQSGYDENDPRVTILQVVRNPSWLTPYFACVIVSLGMVWHFLVHLFGFVAKWRQA